MAYNQGSPPRASTSARIEWMDVLRGGAIVLVVLFHSETQIRGNIDGYPRWLHLFNEAVGPFRMPLLMILSGMLLKKSLSKPLDVYIKGKLRSIGWPYIVWSFALLFLLGATSRITNNEITWQHFAEIFYHPPGHMWYLAYLLIFYVAVLLIPQKVRAYVALFSLMVAAMTADGDWRKMFFLFFFFLLGDLIGRNWFHVEALVMNRATILASLLTALVLGACASYALIDRYDSITAPFIVLSVPVFIFLASVLKSRRLGKFLESQGRHSIVYYVTHTLVLTISYNVFEVFHLAHAVVLSAILPALALGCGYVLVNLRRFAVVDALFIMPSFKKTEVPLKPYAS